jgi:hypothetical protein
MSVESAFAALLYVITAGAAVFVVCSVIQWIRDEF